MERVMKWLLLVLVVADAVLVRRGVIDLPHLAVDEPQRFVAALRLRVPVIE